MSRRAIRQALETALDAVGGINTAWENRDFTPVVGTPYQAAFVLFAAPDNPEIGTAYTERGFLQVNLQYPVGDGPAAADARAEAIRAAFPRGASFTASGKVVHVSNTPEIGGGRSEDDRYLVPVRVPFHSHIRS